MTNKPIKTIILRFYDDDTATLDLLKSEAKDRKQTINKTIKDIIYRSLMR